MTPAGAIDDAGLGLGLDEVVRPSVAAIAAIPPSSAQTITTASTAGAIRPGSAEPRRSHEGASTDRPARSVVPNAERRRVDRAPLEAGAGPTGRPSPSEAGMRITRVRGGSVAPGDPVASGRPAARDDVTAPGTPTLLDSVRRPADTGTPGGITFTVDVGTGADGAADGADVPDGQPLACAAGSAGGSEGSADGDLVVFGGNADATATGDHGSADVPDDQGLRQRRRPNTVPRSPPQQGRPQPASPAKPHEPQSLFLPPHVPANPCQRGLL